MQINKSTKFLIQNLPSSKLHGSQIHGQRGRTLIGIDEMAVINMIKALNCDEKRREIIRNVIGENEFKLYLFI